ncbi:MAG: GWxTD domain-containing protein [Candidatus Aminicenantaceae bacterium]
MIKKNYSHGKYLTAFFISFISSLLLLSFFLTLNSCSYYRVRKNLDPKSKEFFSKVRYIITEEEKKIFLNLPPSEREDFIKEFWKKRDPSPQDEENEFKEEYFARIEEANMLFREGPTPGWLQDRGRVHILFGPPDSRETFPRGYTFYGKPTEIWYYGFFPIIFVDHAFNGEYKLTPQSAYHLAKMNEAQMRLKPGVEGKDVVFDFHISTKKVDKGKISIHIDVPYKNILFMEEENQLTTTLALDIQIIDPSGTEIQHRQKEYLLSMEEDELKEMATKSYSIETLVDLEKGKYTLIAELQNKTTGNTVRKEIKLTV